MSTDDKHTRRALLNALVAGALVFAGGWLLGHELAAGIPPLAGWAGLAVVVALVVFLLGRPAAVGQPPVAPGAGKQQPEPAPSQPQAKPDQPTAAVQMLGLLQRQGRLVDFLQENLDGFQDAQIGAAVRNVHAGCKQVLDEHVTIEPVYTEEEGSQVQVEPGFDARAVQLTGDFQGSPPFQGTLRHRGWRVVRIQLPRQTESMQTPDQKWILSPAEVEVS